VSPASPASPASGPQRVVLHTADDPLRLASGATLGPVEVAWETWGELSPARDNAVLVCHALTGDAHAAGEGGWWSSMVGPGLPVDTDRFFVVCANLLGGCAGTTGPRSTDPATGAPYGPDFPLLAVADLVGLHRELLDHLGVGRLHAAVGGSLGGMQVLQLLLDEPDRVERAVLVAATSRLSAENIALSAVAREAILGDPDFHDGRYAEKGVVPAHGLKVARMAAHVTYVSAQALETKFGRRRPAGPHRLGPDFEVERYLHHQGDTFVQRFDALSYLHLSRLLDHFDPFAEPGAAEALRDVRARVLLVSFDSDWRFGTGHSLRIRDHLQRAGVEVAHHEVASPWGHDSFLLQPPGYHDLVESFLRPVATA
jgi:homoserine O-acetyltransferase